MPRPSLATLLAGTAVVVATGLPADAARSIIDGGLLKNNSVRGSKLRVGAVRARGLANNAVTTRKLATGSVTPAQIAAGAVTSTAVAPGAIGDASIATGAISSRHLAAGAVTNAAIAPGSTTPDRLHGPLISADTIPVPGSVDLGSTAPSLANVTVHGAPLVIEQADVYAGDAANPRALRAARWRHGGCGARRLRSWSLPPHPRPRSCWPGTGQASPPRTKPRRTSGSVAVPLPQRLLATLLMVVRGEGRRLVIVASALEPVYLIGGSDRSKVLRAASRLIDRVEADGGSVELLDAPDATGADVVRAATQLGLLGGWRLIVVRGVDGWRTDDANELDAVIDAPPPATTLALVAGPGMRADHRLRRLITGRERCLMFEAPRGRDLAAYARREADRLGARIEPTALRRLIDLVGDRPVALEQELDKLATYARGEPIDEQLVDSLGVSGGEPSPFALTDAVSTRNRRAALRALDAADQSGAKPHALVPQIARHVELLRQARRAAAAGTSSRGFARDAGIHEFRAAKLMSAASGWSERDASRFLIRMAEVDHAIKGASRTDPMLALERALRDGL